MSLCLMMSLTSCVSVPVPNPDYLKDCGITYLPTGPATNGDVVILAREREYDVKLCNLDKAALRAWFESQCSTVGKRCKYAD